MFNSLKVNFGDYVEVIMYIIHKGMYSSEGHYMMSEQFKQFITAKECEHL